MTKVTVDDVRNRLDAGQDIVIVDSRSAHAWNESNVKAGGAIRIPPDDAEKHIADVKRGAFVVTYCT